MKEAGAIFADQEIEAVPLKWLKYELLERVGLTTRRELDATIYRFNFSDVLQAQNLCQRLMGNWGESERKIMIVLKVVFFDDAGQLPNFRIYAQEDIPIAFDSAISRYGSRAQELWLCRSAVTVLGTNLGGRITLPAPTVFAPSLLEIVWYTSPRKIEEYQTRGFPFPYIRAHKPPGSKRFILDVLNIPHKYAAVAGMKDRLLQETQWVLSSFHCYREKIDLLAEILYGAGARELSIEFKASHGSFSVIDWDTEIETSRRRL